MKKLLPILVVLTMVLTALPAVLGAAPTDPDRDTCGWDECSEADYLGEATDITTTVTVLGDPTNGDPTNGGEPVKPVVKCK
jgi:hypothetical protein